MYLSGFNNLKTWGFHGMLQTGNSMGSLLSSPISKLAVKATAKWAMGIRVSQAHDVYIYIYVHVIYYR